MLEVFTSVFKSLLIFNYLKTYPSKSGSFMVFFKESVLSLQGSDITTILLYFSKPLTFIFSFEFNDSKCSYCYRHFNIYSRHLSFDLHLIVKEWDHIAQMFLDVNWSIDYHFITFKKKIYLFIQSAR